jgi:pimeloyl-ACP methyl ester carboxylesterase
VSAETAYDMQGSGPAVALIHGLGLNRRMWQWQLPALVPHFSVLSYDLLGHGESASPAGVPDLTLFSEQLLRIMDSLGVERAAIVGFSLGGMIARRFGIDHPDRLWAMVILHSAHDRTSAQREAVTKRV